MFGMFQREMAPEGPVEFKYALDFEVPAEEVYCLVDWSDPRNAKRALGHPVETVDADRGLYTMRLNGLPGHDFELTVTRAEPATAYSYTCDVVPRVGRLDSTHETYEITPAGERSCQVVMTVSARFAEGLTLRVYQQEIGMMSRAILGSLAKLKIHAEQGVEAARAVENEHF